MAAICRQELEEIWPRLLLPGSPQPELSQNQDAVQVSSLSFRQIYELNERLQTVRDIYWLVRQTKVKSHADLYKFIEQTRWDLLFPADHACRIDFRSFGSRLYHEASIKQAIAERLSAKGLRLVDQAEQATRLRFYLKDDRLHLLAALNSQAHYQRGLRKSFQVKAPLAEHYAASLIHWYGAHMREHGRKIPSQLYVPFAGSGTLAFEYFTWYYGLAPSLLQRKACCESWLCAPQASISYLRQQLEEHSIMRGASPLVLRFCERNAPQAAELQQNIDHLTQIMQVSSWQKIWQDMRIEAFTGDMFFDDATNWYVDQPLAVLLNPPYGLRLGEEKEAARLYRRIGQRLKTLAMRVSELSGWILVPNELSFHELQAALGSSLTAVLSFNQGGQHIRAVQFFLA